jgi:anion-transporting  ArsA/GET3 family ATPase
VLLIDAIKHGGTRIALAGRSLRNGGDLLELDTATSLDEYLRIYLKFPIPASRLGPIARIFEYVATAAPGVTEILIVGKVGHEVREGTWDRVIIDAPATGHVVELLAAPENLGTLINVGPLADQTGWLSDILGSHERTGVWIVTTPEELPVSESFELIDRIRSETRVGLAGAVINRMPRLLSEAGLEEADRLSEGVGGLAIAASIAALSTRTALRESTRFADVWSTTGLPWFSIPVADDPVEAARRMWSGLS